MDVDDSIKCKGCPKSFKRHTILKHLSHVKKCKQLYSEDELNDMNATFKKLSAIKKREKMRQNYDSVKRAQKYQKERENYTTKKSHEIYQRNKDKIALKYTSRKREREEKEIGV